MALWSSEIKELEKLYESLKGKLPDLEKELERLIKADDENMILLYSRRCLEVIITDLCECELNRPRKTEPLKGIIDKLHKEGKVPAHIITSMHGLNELSTYGAHPKDFDPRQVRTTLINLDTIIEWYLKYKVIDIKGEEEIQFKGESLKEVKKGAKIEEQEKPTKSPKQKLLSGVLITAILVIAAILIYPKIFKRNTLEKLRSSNERMTLAVMPFQNMTNDTLWNVWQEGIQNEMITSLTNSKELKVRQTESINNLIQSKGLTNYASLTPSVASTISQKLDANIFVYGSIKQSGKTIRVNAQLIDSKSEEIFKSFQIDGTEEKILDITDSLSVMLRDFIVISILEKNIIKDFRTLISTSSSIAYRYYMYGNQAFYKYDYPTSSEWYRKAIDIDTNFTEAIRMLVYSLGNQGLIEESTKWRLKHYQKRDQMPEQEKIWANILYAQSFETPDEVIKYFKLLIAYDDELPVPHSNLGGAYFGLGLYDLAITESEKELEIYKKWDSKPRWSLSYISLGNEYHKMGMYKKEKELYVKAERDFPDDPIIIANQAALSFTLGDTIEANRHIEKYVTIRKKRSASEAEIRTGLVGIYTEGGVLDKAEAIHREALSLEPENPTRINSLAYFLINEDRNIEEGLELVDTALKLSPDNYNFLHTKGWGLFKQGKYQEALDILQKSWDLRMEKAGYNHQTFLHLEEAKKAVASQKNN